MNTRFVCENNLGKLAKWLSILGFDIIYDKTCDIVTISNFSSSENRIIITTRVDKNVYNTVNEVIQIESDDFELQLVQILKKYNFKKSEFKIFSRCYKCNTETIEVNRMDHESKIPPKAFEFGEHFRICQKCDKVYWLGSHYAEIVKYIDLIYLKYFSCCSRCGVNILPEQNKYNTLISIKSMYDRLDLDDSISEDEINKSIEEIIQMIEKTTVKELNNDVYYRKEFLLCSMCHSKMIKVIEEFLR
ncbi:hypothetical protein KAJ27_19300 [bacterium]|nr:hypothetical protein [bacterium]